MNALVIGCGRVGSSVAKQLADEGWDVSVIDENEESLERLGDRWPGRFIVGHGMDVTVLRDAGIEDAEAVVVATDGDNTNIVIGQVAQKRFDINCVVVRVLDRSAPTSTPHAECGPSARRRLRSTSSRTPFAPARFRQRRWVPDVRARGRRWEGRRQRG